MARSSEGVMKEGRKLTAFFAVIAVACGMTMADGAIDGSCTSAVDWTVRGEGSSIPLRLLSNSKRTL